MNKDEEYKHYATLRLGCKEMRDLFFRNISIVDEDDEMKHVFHLADELIEKYMLKCEEINASNVKEEIKRKGVF